MYKNKIIIIIVVSIFIIFSYVIYVKLIKHEEINEEFINAIHLNETRNISFDSTILREWIVTDQGKLVCVSLQSKNIYFADIEENRIIKSISIDKVFKKAKLLIKDDTLYIIFNNDYLYVVDVNTMELKDIFYDKGKRYFDDTTEFYDKFLITNNSSYISVINLDNGDITAFLKVFSIREVKLYNDVLFCTTGGYNVHAFHPTNLTYLWKHVKTEGRGSATIGFKDKLLYFNDDEKMTVFNYETGEKVNEFLTPWASRIFYLDESIYLYQYKKSIANLDIDAGNILWNINVNIYQVDLIEDYIFYLDKDKNSLNKINRFTSKLIWETSWYGKRTQKINQCEKYDIIQLKSGSIYLIDKDTGEKLWNFQNYKNLENVSFELYENSLFVFDGDKNIIVYKLDVK